MTDTKADDTKPTKSASPATTTKAAATAPAALDVVPPGTPMFSEPVDGEPTGVHVPGQPPGGTVGDGPVVLHYNPAKK